MTKLIRRNLLKSRIWLQHTTIKIHQSVFLLRNLHCN